MPCGRMLKIPVSIDEAVARTASAIQEIVNRADWPEVRASLPSKDWLAAREAVRSVFERLEGSSCTPWLGILEDAVVTVMKDNPISFEDCPRTKAAIIKRMSNHPNVVMQDARAGAA